MMTGEERPVKWTFRDSLGTEPTRAWINQPSTLQPFHRFHGLNVITVPPIMRDGRNDYMTVYFTEGDSISIRIQVSALAKGWQKTSKE